MPSSLNIEIPDEVRNGLRGLKTPVLLGAVARGMEKGTALMVGAITRTRLTGPGPYPVPLHKLGVVTGRLRRSFHWKGAVRIQGNNVSTDLGATVEYAALHEFGFKGTADVKKHSRKGKKGKSHDVAAHTRKVNIPERRPIRSGMAEHSGLVMAKIADEVVAEIRKP